MRYASVCSGVEAASLAWMPLGWEAAWFSEIEPFPCAVLAERFPSVPNLGDMTKISIQPNGDITYGSDAVIPNDERAIDLIVGGTPCQDASIAGKRAGLVEGERSKLAFTFTRLAYELATYRGLRWVVWENVPGVFSLNKGRDFATFLSSVAGRNVEPPKDGWGTFGIVPEGSRGNFGLCWRVLDVQYVRVDGFPRAIPQRRRRVFLVGYIGDWRRAAEVLFEPSGMCGDNPPQRSKRQEAAADAGGCVEKADGFRESSYGAFADGNESGTLKAVGGVLGGAAKRLSNNNLQLNGGGIGKR
jgi:DNA (cytosine-5)-methyltransferase 1